jgi:hypothetical protein
LGIPIETLTLLLLFPVIATLVAFFRQVLGIKAFGIYTPSIITLVFYFIGLKYGIVIYVTVIALGMATRLALRRLRILYLPRVAITMTVVSLAVVGILAIGASFGRTGFAVVSVFPLLILVILVEKFVSVQIEKGNMAAIILAGETLIVSLAGFALLNTDIFVMFFLQYPWVIIFIIPINILLGKWTGLRLTEYFRFWSVLKQIK